MSLPLTSSRPRRRPMYGAAREHYRRTLDEIRESGLWKKERVITSAQGADIEVTLPGAAPRHVLNFCANNYLGLGNHPTLLEAAHGALHDRGYGLSSVRFICGTQDAHTALEKKLSTFLGMDDTILYSSCFDA